jgi:hypothetical protein
MVSWADSAGIISCRWRVTGCHMQGLCWACRCRGQLQPYLNQLHLLAAPQLHIVEAEIEGAVKVRHVATLPRPTGLQAFASRWSTAPLVAGISNAAPPESLHGVSQHACGPEPDMDSACA